MSLQTVDESVFRFKDLTDFFDLTVSAFCFVFSVDMKDMDMEATLEAVHISTLRPRDLVDTDMTDMDMAVDRVDMVVDIPTNTALM